MKRYISIILAFVILITSLCGCSLFNDNANNGVLSIPRKGQEYYKRVIYNNTGNGGIITQYTNNYLTIFESDINLVFDQNAKLVYDGSEGKLTSAKTYGDKIICGEYLINLKNGNKEEFFSGYQPLDYSNGYWSVTNDNNKCGIIDEKGNEIIPFKYDIISTFDKKGYALVGDFTEQKFGMVDKENNLVIPINYKYLVPFNAKVNSSYYSNLYLDYEPDYNYTLVAGTDSESTFTIDRNGKKTFDLEDSEYKPISGSSWTLTQNLIPVEKDGLCGYIDMQGNEVIPLKYNKIAWDFINGYSCASVGSNYGIINVKSEEVLPFEYSSITPFDQNGFAIANTNNSGETQIIDLAGNVAYSTNNSIEALGGGYFKEDYNQVIQITTDKSDYETYTPKEFTK